MNILGQFKRERKHFAESENAGFVRTPIERDVMLAGVRAVNYRCDSDGHASGLARACHAAIKT